MTIGQYAVFEEVRPSRHDFVHVVSARTCSAWASKIQRTLLAPQNVAASDGSCIIVVDFASFNVSAHATFRNNAAGTTAKGGALAAFLNAGPSFVGANSLFDANTAARGAAAYVYNKGSISFGDGAQFVNNVATEYGGWVRVQGGSSYVGGLLVCARPLVSA